ncbi:hypothetical protein JCM3770_005519 [Rhodotorula araucariae]
MAMLARDTCPGPRHPHRLAEDDPAALASSSVHSSDVPSDSGDRIDDDGDDNADVDGVPVVIDTDGVFVPPLAQVAPELPARAALGSSKRLTKSAQDPTDSEADKTSLTRPFQQYWREHVSKLHPPHAWFHEAAPAASSSSAAPAPPPRIGCTLTLTLPDASTRIFSAPPTHPTRKAARDAAFARAWQAGAHEAGRAARAELGWEAEAEEERVAEARVKESVGGDKPWEKLKVEGERWMASPVKWEFEEDKLNTTHGCRLTVPVSPFSTLTFLTPTTYANHRDAKDAAARLALEAGVPAQYEAAFKDRLNRESGGIITFGAGVAEGAAGDTDGPHDPVLLLQAEVRNAFGGVNKYVEWVHTHVAPHNGSASSARSLLPCTLTLTFPATPFAPDPPGPFTVSVPAQFHTKQHARISCAALAFKEGLRERLRPYQDARAEELRRRKVEREDRERVKRDERDKGVRTVPKAGTVAYEDLDALDNPAAYLNLCAQQWTGNSSPLMFEYQALEVPGVPGKQHGCVLTVFVDRSFSKTYTVATSPATPSRAAAKDAAIRLALRTRVLDLLKPADYNADVAAASKSAKRARKDRVRDKASAGNSSGEGDRGAAAGSVERAPPQREASASQWALTLPLGQSAVAFLDQTCLAYLGTGALPMYDVRQAPSTGLFGATLRIPLPPTSARGRGPLPFERAYQAAPVHASRAEAQEAAAMGAVQQGVIELLRGGEGPGAPVASVAVGVHAGVAGLGAVDAAARTQAGGGVGGAGAGGKRGREEGDAEEREEEEGYDGGSGGAVQTLREGCACVLGGEEQVRPKYSVVQTASAFGASVVVPLDKLTCASRAFGVPTTFPCRDTACDAAASAALTAGVLELVQSGSQSPRPPLTASAPSQPRSGKQKTPPRSSEEQAALRRAAYGGFGAATAATVAAAVDEAKAHERDKARREETSRVGANLLLRPLPPPVQAIAPQLQCAAVGAPGPASGAGAAVVGVVDGPAVHHLKEYCLAKALPIPILQHEPVPGAGGASHRVWVVVRGFKFELPSVGGTASAARSKLATRVLKHLRAEDGGGNA